jgi:uncharacterized protein
MACRIIASIIIGGSVTVGILKLHISIDGANSLKEKRKVLKSIIDRLRSRFNISVAEVGYNEIWKNALIGVTCISNNKRHVDRIMAGVVNFVENDGRIVLVDFSNEII